MTTGKVATLTFRIEPGLKEALRMAADQEHRSIVNMIEVMIRDHCGGNSVTISEHRTPLIKNKKTATDKE